MSGATAVARRYGGAGKGNRKGSKKLSRTKEEAMAKRNPGGTPETIRQKLSLVYGKSPEGKLVAGDPTLSTCVLDRMRARDIIPDHYHKAGSKYAGLRFRLFGRGAVSVEKQHYSEMDEETEARLREIYEAADRAAQRAGDLEYYEVRNVCIYDMTPRWMRGGLPAGKQYNALMRALDELAKHFGIREVDSAVPVARNDA